MSPADMEVMAHLCRVTALEDAVASLLRAYNREHANEPERQATAISIELDERGHGDVQYMRCSFPLEGMSL